MNDTDNKFIGWTTTILRVAARPLKAKSGGHTSVYELKTDNGSYFLKIRAQLELEKARLEGLEDKVAVPEVLDFLSHSGQQAFLMTRIDGLDLADDNKS